MVNWLESVGLVCAIVFGCKLIYNLLHFAYTTFLGRRLGHGIDLSKCGPWAVITGATDGIGKAYAKQLANAGLNIVLISRTPAKLNAVANEIKEASRRSSPIKVKTIAVDFTKADDSVYGAIRQGLDGLNIGLLVNNVGMAPEPEPFGMVQDEKFLNDILNCNALSLCRMCHIVVPQMAKKRSGVIINIGSIASVGPCPFYTTYGATKAYIEKFSKDLAVELRPHGITVQTVQPCYVATNMCELKPSITVPTADTYAKAALNTLGLEDVTAGYWYHKIQFYVHQIMYFFARGFHEKAVVWYMHYIYMNGLMNKKNKAY